MNTKPNFLSKILRTALTLAAMVTLLFAAPTKTRALDRLKLVGKQLCNASGTPIQLRGWSTFRLKDESAAYQKEHLQKTKEMGANVVRCVVYVEGEDSYTYKNDQDGTTSQVKTWIDQCAEIGLYCLVDWRVEVPGNPNDWAYNGAENFFREITSYVKSKQYQHVLYEICDQPNGCTWTDIKQYANKVLPIISQNDPGSIVIVGTQQWCTLLDDYDPEDPDEPDYHDGPVSKPITGYNNLYIMYSFHYYTEESKDIIDRLSAAADDIPLFVTEWGFSDNKDIDKSVNDELLAVCNGQNDGGQFISWCNWALCETDHPYSALTSVSSFTLSSSGEYVVSMLKKKEMEDIAIYPAGAVPYVVATMTDGWTIGNGVQAFLPKSYEAGASEITLTPLAGAPQGKVVILGNATDGAVLPDQIIPVPAPADETAVEESYTAALGQMDTKHFAITDGSKTLGDVIANDNTGVTASNAIVMVLKGGTFKAVDISEGDLKQNAKPGLLLFILSKWEYLNVGSNDNAGGAGSRGIGIGEGGATAIDKSHLIIDNSAGVWYDLQGRRMQGQPTRKGIYVRNCKKIVIR